MSHSENINELATALCKAQSEMLPAIKESINPFFKSKYADLANVTEAARPYLSKNGLCVMQTTDILGDKNILITTLAHTSGQWINSSIVINPVKNDPQGLGAAMTYLRRYSYAAIVGVVTEDDDGEVASGRGQPDKKPEQSKKPEPKTNEIPKPTNLVDIDPKISQQQLDHFLDLCTQADEKCIENMDAHLKKEYNVTSYMNMNQEAYEICTRCLERNIRSKKDKTAA